jgi:hypothetical protein
LSFHGACTTAWKSDANGRSPRPRVFSASVSASV